MRRFLICVLADLAIMACCVSARSADQEKVTVRTAPPVVVKTVPEAGDATVDPALGEIRVTFSKKMLNQSWSWAGADAWVAGRPHYLADGKTCVLPVKLEPGKTYAVWLNSPSFRNFKDAQGRSAIPYLLVFETSKQ